MVFFSCFSFQLLQQSTRALSGISTTPGSTNLGSVVTPVVVSGNGSSSSSGGDDTLTGLPQGAEIKIPGVGATPVAVSTTLPAAVAQLSQQGNIIFVLYFCVPQF